MISTRVVMPFLAAALFFAPALVVIVPIAAASSVVAIILGALWLLLLILMLRDNPSLPPVLAGAATWLLARGIGGWVADSNGWSAPVGQMVFVLAVMGVLAAFNTLRIFRARGKR